MSEGSLSLDQVKALMKKKAAEKPKRKSGKKKIDDSVRDVPTWFALSPQTRDVENYTDLTCENPDCIDPRPGRTSPLTGKKIRHQFCVSVNGKWMCRFCFLDGWLLTDPDQLELE